LSEILPSSSLGLFHISQMLWPTNWETWPKSHWYI